MKALQEAFLLMEMLEEKRKKLMRSISMSDEDVNALRPALIQTAKKVPAEKITILVDSNKKQPVVLNWFRAHVRKPGSKSLQACCKVVFCIFIRKPVVLNSFKKI